MKHCLLIIALVLAPVCAVGQTVTITSDTEPPGVVADGTHQFTCANCPSVVWSVAGTGVFSGAAGTIDASTGLYHAPTTVFAKDQSKGWQLGPLDNGAITPVNSLSVHTQSAYWMSRIANDCNPVRGCSWTYHRPIMPVPGAGGFYDNIVDGSTTEQPTHFYFNGGKFDNTNFKQPLPPNVYMESGWSLNNWSWAGEFDQHLFSVNRDTGEDQERYKYFPGYTSYSIVAGNPTIINFTHNLVRVLQNPLNVQITGSTDCTAINRDWRGTIVTPTQMTIPFNSTGCHLTNAKPHTYAFVCRDGGVACNSVSGAKWAVNSNWLGSGTDAAGLPISRISIHGQEWWNNVTQNITDPACSCVVAFRHPIRTQLDNLAIAPADLYPSQTGHNVTGGHPQIQPQSISNANPAIVTLPANGSNSYFGTFYPCIDTGAHQWTTCTNGNTFQVVFIGGTGSWAALNGQHLVATVTGTGLNSQFSIPVDTTAFGPKNAGLLVYFDWIPYGARFRLKASFDNTTVCNDVSLTCKLEQAYLNTLKTYGLMLTDGTSPSDNWNVSMISDEFFPDELGNAIEDLRHSTALGYNPSWPSGGGFEQYFDIVDTDPQQVYTCNFGDVGCASNSYKGTTNVDRITVTATASGHGSASLDVNPIGTVVGCAKSRITIPANGMQWPSDCWVTGNATVFVDYSLSPSVSGASVSSGGVVTAPSSLSPNQFTRTILSACSHVVPTQCAYTSVYFVPVSPDGNIRLWAGGEDTTYTDASSKVWYGAVTSRSWDTWFENASGVGFADLLGTWHDHSASWVSNGTVDPKLYGQSLSGKNDLNFTVALPNGSYNLTLYGEPGYGITQPVSSNCVGSYPCAINVYDVEINGTVAASYQDGFALAGGLYKGYQSTYSATVSNGLLQFNGRIREVDSSGHGMSFSSLLISPSGGPGCTLAITGTLPGGTVGTPYSHALGVSPSGACTAPYHFQSLLCLNGSGTPCSGHDINGLTMADDGTYDAGSPLAAGLAALSIGVCDSAAHCASKLFLVGIATGTGNFNEIFGATASGVVIP